MSKFYDFFIYSPGNHPKAVEFYFAFSWIWDKQNRSSSKEKGFLNPFARSNATITPTGLKVPGQVSVAHERHWALGPSRHG